MTTNAFKQILVATDLSESARDAARLGARVAKVNGGNLHLLHVRLPMLAPYDLPDFAPIEIEPALEGELRERLQQLALELDQPAATALLTDPAVADAVLRYASEHSIDLIVVGTHGRRGLSRMFLGSVAAELARTAPLPVLVVPLGSERGDHYRRVLAAVDFSASARAALQEAATIAEAHKAPLIALHVVDDAELPPYFAGTIRREAAEMALEHLNKVLGELGLAQRAEPMVVTGAPHTAISATARQYDADLIVTGSAGLRGLQRLLIGSVTERVLRTASCAVLIHRGPVAAGL